MPILTGSEADDSDTLLREEIVSVNEVAKVLNGLPSLDGKEDEEPFVKAEDEEGVVKVSVMAGGMGMKGGISLVPAPAPVGKVQFQSGQVG